MEPIQNNSLADNSADPSNSGNQNPEFQANIIKPSIQPQTDIAEPNPQTAAQTPSYQPVSDQATQILPPQPVAPLVPFQSPPQAQSAVPDASMNQGLQAQLSSQPNYFAPDSVQPLPGKSKMKMIFLVVGIVSVLALLSGGFVFGFYLPNQPQNVWKTGLNRSGKAFTTLVNTATEQKAINTFKKTELTATVDATFQKTSYSGSLNLKFEPSKANGGFNLTAKEKGTPDKVLSAKLLSELKAGSQYPSVYFLVTGIKSFGLDEFAPDIAKYDGKWISVEESYLKTLGTQPTTAKQNQDKQLSASDTAELVRAASSVTSEYFLTADSTKAVFVQKKFVAKEKVDGISTYHYEVGINKTHAKNYCSELGNRLFATGAYKKLPWVDSTKLDDEKKSFISGCEDSVNNDIKDSDTFDVWVDAHYKLIYKARFPDSSNSEAYTEIGQVYKGGDDITLFAASHDGKAKTDGKFSITTNTKTYATKGTLTYTGKDTNNEYDIKVSLESKPYTGEIDVTKPAGATSIEQIIKSLGYDVTNPNIVDDTSTTPLNVPVATKARNTERQTDIKAVASHLEVYNAQNGMYPTFANLNDASWVAANLKGLDKEALRDPSGKLFTFLKSSTAIQYGYAPTGSGGTVCDNTAGNECAAFTLTYTEEGGVQKSVQSLN